MAQLSSLSELKAAADAAETAFSDLACRHYPDGRWGAYRAADAGQEVPADVRTAMEAYISALHAYYLARDGEGGFLGGL